MVSDGQNRRDAVLKHIARYGLTLRPVLERLFYRGHEKSMDRDLDRMREYALGSPAQRAKLPPSRAVGQAVPDEVKTDERMMPCQAQPDLRLPTRVEYHEEFADRCASTPVMEGRPMNGFDLLLFAVAALIAVSSLVRLMLARRDRLIADVQRQIATQKKQSNDR